MQTASQGRARPFLSSLLALACLLPACLSDSEGLNPPRDKLYYPTNLVTSPGGKALYVTNSDFDLQYNGGTVQVLDLESLRANALLLQEALNPDASGNVRGADACKDVLLGENPETILHPGPCSPLAVEPYIKTSTTIGAFSSSAVFVRRPDDLRQGADGQATARLFVSVRGDPSITYFDVPDDSDPSAVSAPPACNGSPFCLLCDAAGDDDRCGADHRVGEDPEDSVRNLTLPVEPFGIGASEDTEAIVTAHQTENVASLVINNWGAEPRLEYYLLNLLPPGPTDVLAIPEPGFVKADRAPRVDPDQPDKPPTDYADATYSYEPGFVITFRASPQLHLLRYHSDEGSDPKRPFLARAGGININVNSSGIDSRGGAIDASERRACEASCAADTACLRGCASVPLRLFVANRTPPSLLIGEITTSLVVDEASGLPASEAPITGVFDELDLIDAVPLTFGPSRVAVGNVIDKDGEMRVRAFVVAFDSRLVFVYDPAANRVEAVIRTGRGPHAIAFDTGGEGEDVYSFMYIGHFTDSYIGVVDLDMRKLQTFGSMFLTIGQPTPPRESK